ncbi:5-carboxymethyl-2-hydroxymuconate isomerase [Pandoraea pulmonicola]|uniref:5-carboxymethyl-2-hydroxymuconate isomerase n=2 Tax=Pandoraea pulmonicola TaxID=93221 RepID=A0AAJ4ZGC1_PANPU|nr:fumarylacetoacetate hydrolase family protein [Pandoraea pulmonicola]AJC22891.1 5-carboxymethyl-2-hydroxymuconate isomerase [Pandoraea pulmonicola]SUA92785.1 Ureidoglycolate lyase [Pandoraea pulmonicola]
MKLCRFTFNGSTRLGKIEGNDVVDLSAVVDTGNSMRLLLERLDTLRPLLGFAGGPRIPLQQVKLESPINDPRKYLIIGMNYQAHAKEAAAAGIPIPASQLWTNKQVSCITGPYDPILLPAKSDKLDYEVELAFVVGKRCRHASVENALSYVGGYLVANDVSVRDWQQLSTTHTLGKSFDSHGPLGPWITTADEVPDPQALTLHLSVNGSERQRSSTADMIYSVAAQIAHLSAMTTLEPGDIIATGTPSGVGVARGVFLKAGDVVRAEIDGLGFIENVVEPEA